MICIRRIIDVQDCLAGLKVVVFDLDDTLYSEKEYVKSGFLAVAQLFPNIKNAEAKLWKAFEKDKKSAIDEFLRFENIYSEVMKQKCLEEYRTHQPNIHLYDGVVGLLAQIRNQGMGIGIITDGRSQGQRTKIRSLGLEKYVDHIIVTDELGGIEYRKPNEKAFVIMRDLFGVEFNEMCYVGDNIMKDFIAPDKLGMKSIRFVNVCGLYCENNS